VLYLDIYCMFVLLSESSVTPHVTNRPCKTKLSIIHALNPSSNVRTASHVKSAERGGWPTSSVTRSAVRKLEQRHHKYVTTNNTTNTHTHTHTHTKTYHCWYSKRDVARSPAVPKSRAHVADSFNTLRCKPKTTGIHICRTAASSVKRRWCTCMCIASLSAHSRSSTRRRRTSAGSNTRQFTHICVD
jgi:hypothetical protein